LLRPQSTWRRELQPPGPSRGTPMMRAHAPEQGMVILYHHRTQAGWVESVHINGIAGGLRALGHHVPIVGPPHASSPGSSERSPSAAARALRFAARRLPQGAFELMEMAYNLAALPHVTRAARESGAGIIYERAAAYCCVGALVSRRLGIP